MMRLRLAAALLLAAAPCAASLAQSGPPGGGGRGGGGAPPGGGRGYANPSALIAAEIALSRETLEVGQWKAYRKAAAEGAEMLVPKRVSARQWLKGQKSDPASPVHLEPYTAWMSCDGSFGVVEGAWQDGSDTGQYAAVWQRQKKGDYKWLIRHPVGPDGPVSEPDMLSATVADCAIRERQGPPQDRGRQPERPSREETPPVDAQSGFSADRSLFWQSGRDAAGTPWLLVKIRKDGDMQTVLGAELGPAQTEPDSAGCACHD